MLKVGLCTNKGSKITKLRVVLFLLPVYVSFFCKNELVSLIIAPKGNPTTPKGPLVKALALATLDLVLGPSTHWEHWSWHLPRQRTRG